MTYECANPKCAGREIRRVRNRWIHEDTGLAMCEPLNDPSIRAKPKSTRNAGP